MFRVILFIGLLLISNLIHAQDTTAVSPNQNKRYIALDFSFGFPDLIHRQFTIEYGLSLQPFRKLNLLCLRPYFLFYMVGKTKMTSDELGLMLTSRWHSRKFLFEPGIAISRIQSYAGFLWRSPLYTEIGVSARLGAFWKFHKNFNLGLSSHLNYHPSNWLYSTMVTLRVTNGAKHLPKVP
jgi:hypothetical protein